MNQGTMCGKWFVREYMAVKEIIEYESAKMASASNEEQGCKKTCYLSLGGNLGQPKQAICQALSRMGSTDGLRVVAVSSYYKTAAWGKTDQPDFINIAAAVEISCSPLELLHIAQQIEQDLGRARHEHWGARTIDIDLLYIEGFVSNTLELTLPHPYMLQRAFVMVPLAEIVPKLQIEGKLIGEYCEVLKEQGVEKISSTAGLWPHMIFIACVSSNWGIGCEGRLLFKLPIDLARFKRLTMGNIVIMGRCTMESLPGQRPLSGRINIVLTRQKISRYGFIFCHSLPELQQVLTSLQGTEENVPKKIFVIGGEQMYRLLLPYCCEAAITYVDCQAKADAFLPDFSHLENFYLEDAEKHDADGYSFEYRDYQLIGGCLSKPML